MSESSDKKAIRSGIWYVLASFITRGIGFLTMPIFVRLMTKEEIGQFVNFSTWLTVLTPVMTLNMDSSVTTAKFEFKEKLNDHITSVLVLGTLITSGFYLIFLIFGDTAKSLLNINSLQLNVMFIFMMTAPALNIFQVKNRLEYKYKLSTALSLTSIGIGTALSIAAVLNSDNKVTGRILGLYIPSIVLNVIVYIYLISKSRTVKKQYLKYGLMISLPLAFHTVAGSILNSFDKIMINSMVGNNETAMYSIAYSCGTVIQLLWYSLNQAWAPWAFEQMDKNEGNKLKKASKVYMLLFGLIVVTAILAAPELLLIIGGKDYAPALSVIPPVMCGFVFQLVYSLYVNIETLEKKTGYVAVGTIIAALFNILLNYIFIPIFGYTAASYTTLAGYAVLFLIHFFFVHHLGKTGWYDTVFNFRFLSFFAIVPFLMSWIYKLTVVRYIIIVCITVLLLAAVYRHKDEIKKKL